MSIPYWLFYLNVYFWYFLFEDVCLFVSLKFLHDKNLQSICTINFVNFLWLFVTQCCKIEMFIFCSYFISVTKTQDFMWQWCSLENNGCFFHCFMLNVHFFNFLFVDRKLHSSQIHAIKLGLGWTNYYTYTSTMVKTSNVFGLLWNINI